jgi:hypothetical protein
LLLPLLAVEMQDCKVASEVAVHDRPPAPPVGVPDGSFVAQPINPSPVCAGIEETEDDTLEDDDDLLLDEEEDDLLLEELELDLLDEELLGQLPYVHTPVTGS